MHLCICVKSFHFLSLSSVSLNQSPLKCPTNMSPCSFPNQYAVSIKRGNLWSELAILSCWAILHHCHTKTRVPILWQPACISPPRTSLGSFFCEDSPLHLLWSAPLSLTPCVKTLLSPSMKRSHLHNHLFIGKSMRKEWMGQPLLCPWGHFFLEMAPAFPKAPGEGPPPWTHQPRSLVWRCEPPGQPDLPLCTRTVKWVNEPRQLSLGVEEETLQCCLTFSSASAACLPSGTGPSLHTTTPTAVLSVPPQERRGKTL